ncbi:MAG: hypothetical protein ACLTJ5_13960 [Clostridium sp.]
MDKKITYHEQTSRENTLKLRSVLQTLPDFTKDFFFVPLSQIHLLKPEYLMYMIFVCFFNFCR